MSSTHAGKLFAIVDCDNFYVSCERVFQPRLKGKPVIVLSNNDGCVVARSPEAKVAGVGMGVPFFQVKELVKEHKIAVFSSNYTLYGDMSRRVMETLGELVPFVDVYSIDEAFLTLETGDGQAYGQRIRETVHRYTDIPVTIGIAETKTLAKIAMEYAKRHVNRVFDLTSQANVDDILATILAQDIWGVGIKTAEWLYERGIHTARDVKYIDDDLIRKRAGITGLRVVHELRGISCIDLRPMDAPRKGISSSRSFGRYVTDITDLYESVSTHATRAAEKLRQDGSVAGMLSVFITTNVFSKDPRYANTACMSVIPSSNASDQLIRLAKIGVNRIYKPGYKYIKAGVTLTKLSPETQRQLDAFSRPDMDREARLYRAVDRINNTFGTGTVQHAACGIEKGWKMKNEFQSPRYTTSWLDLPVARFP